MDALLETHVGLGSKAEHEKIYKGTLKIMFITPGC